MFIVLSVNIYEQLSDNICRPWLLVRTHLFALFTLHSLRVWIVSFSTTQKMKDEEQNERFSNAYMQQSCCLY
jgi:hypothetical protein